MSISPTVIPGQNCNFAMDAGHELTEAQPKLAEKLVITNYQNPQTLALKGADLKKSGLELLLIHGR